MSPQQTVRAGYDRLAGRYGRHFAALHRKHYRAWIAELRRRVPRHGLVVELGCADGIPVGRSLARHCRYHGVDLSPVQVALARRNVPNGDFSVGDMNGITFEPGSVDGVVALYSIIHVPQAKQAPLFRRVASWLKPGGVFMAVVGAGRWTGVAEDWIVPGVAMYWSHGHGDDYVAMARRAGFDLLDRALISEGEAAHTYLLLHKPERARRPEAAQTQTRNRNGTATARMKPGGVDQPAAPAGGNRGLSRARTATGSRGRRARP